jgi:hypothetical protein
MWCADNCVHWVLMHAYLVPELIIRNAARVEDGQMPHREILADTEASFVDHNRYLS